MYSMKMRIVSSTFWLFLASCTTFTENAVAFPLVPSGKQHFFMSQSPQSYSALLMKKQNLYFGSPTAMKQASVVAEEVETMQEATISSNFAEEEEEMIVSAGEEQDVLAEEARKMHEEHLAEVARQLVKQHLADRQAEVAKMADKHLAEVARQIAMQHLAEKEQSKLKQEVEKSKSFWADVLRIEVKKALADEVRKFKHQVKPAADSGSVTPELYPQDAMWSKNL